MESTSTATNRIRKWKVFPGKNKFCCNGRVVTGAQLGIFYFTCVLIIVTSGLFFGVEYADIKLFNYFVDVDNCLRVLSGRMIVVALRQAYHSVARLDKYKNEFGTLMLISAI
jgi:TM2 domain-containing membrane protein YozV